MIRVKCTLSKENNVEKWIGLALGNIDDYGNPFTLITLRWNSKNRLHRCSDYQKVNGFEDTIIRSLSTGFKISYEIPGNVRFERPIPSIASFEGKLAKTPHNMTVLSRHYMHGLWTIKELHIDNEVRAMYENWWNELTDEQQEKAKEELRLFNTDRLEDSKRDKSTLIIDPRYNQDALEDKSKNLSLREIEIAEREAVLKKREEEINKTIVEKISKGEAAPVTYSREALRNLHMGTVRAYAKERKVAVSNSDKKEELINKIFGEPAVKHTVGALGSVVD